MSQFIEPAGKPKGRISALKSAISKRSPKIVRKMMSGKKGKKERVKIGKSAANSELEGCKENGWLCDDADVFKGINYKVKYLGSVEVDFDGADSTNNQEHAQKAMRALLAHSKGASKDKIPKLVLQVSVGCIKLLSLDGKTPIMRHSTTRIAYSTVDAENPKLFSYVGMVKDTQLTLCHIFKCKTPKQGYEMTFVCAQAFDLNFRTWQTNRAAALKEAKSSEGADIEPTKAWQKKKAEGAADTTSPAEVVSDTEYDEPDHGDDSAAAAAAGGGGGGGAAVPAGSEDLGASDVAPPTTRSRRTSLVPVDAGAEPAAEERDPVFLSIMEGQDPAAVASKYFASLGVNMIEDDDDESAYMAVEARSASSFAPNVLEIGSQPEEYNKARRASVDTGYMTVGANMAFADDDAADDWD